MAKQKKDKPKPSKAHKVPPAHMPATKPTPEKPHMPEPVKIITESGEPNIAELAKCPVLPINPAPEADCVPHAPPTLRDDHLPHVPVPPPIDHNKVEHLPELLPPFNGIVKPWSPLGLGPWILLTAADGNELPYIPEEGQRVLVQFSPPATDDIPQPPEPLH